MSKDKCCCRCNCLSDEERRIEIERLARVSLEKNKLGYERLAKL